MYNQFLNAVSNGVPSYHTRRYVAADVIHTQQLRFNRFSIPTVNKKYQFTNVCKDRSLVLYAWFSSSLLRCRDSQNCLVTPVEVSLGG